MVLAVNPRASLDGQHFHVVVIGGGINGVAVARQIARAGKRVLLAEQNDFASGVTSRSTRIIHGGLRYLEHGELSLVRESLRERARLLRTQPQLVHPMHFLLLMNENSNRSAMKVRAGLWLYRRLAGAQQGKGANEMELKRLEGALDAGHRWSFFNYEDAQCEFPERLVAEWLLEAAEAGATIRNHTEALAVDVSHGRVHGVLLRDQLTGRDQRVDAGWVINCTGPWADRVCQRSSIRISKPLLGGVRGHTLCCRAFPVRPAQQSTRKPWTAGRFSLFPGTIRCSSAPRKLPMLGIPEKPCHRSDEINYLVRSVAQLFPKAKITGENVKYSFAGVRPLPYAPDTNPSSITRTTSAPRSRRGRCSAHDFFDRR